MDELFAKFWVESGLATCYTSSQAKRRFKIAFIAGFKIGYCKADNGDSEIMDTLE